MKSNSLNTSTHCFDAGSDYCPCALADLGLCVACSLLRGEETCDCAWNGVCVYQEYIRRKKRSKNPRRTVSSHLLKMEKLTFSPTSSFILRLSVPKELAVWCILPGTFLLVRPFGEAERYNVPVTVLDADKSSVYLAVEVKGPKTLAIEKCAENTGQFSVTGPFTSGIQGLKYLTAPKTKRVLAIAKGMGQPAIVSPARFVSSRGGYFKAMMGPGNIGGIFVKDILMEMGIQILCMEKEADHNLSKIKMEISSGGYDLIFSAGSEAQHRALRSLASCAPNSPRFAWSSNFSMTCAEGICGSCLKNGFRTCKSDVGSFPDILSEEVFL